MRLYQAGVSAAAVAAVVLLCFAAVLLREATSPSGEGYWTAMAPAPGGGLYIADEARRQLLVLNAAGGARVLGAAPLGIYRALAADSSGRMLLGTESGLFVSDDAGGHWRFAIPSRRFTAVAITPGYWLAGAWNDALYVSYDQGASWSKATVPAGDVEFEQLESGFVATLLDLLESGDGRVWRHVASSKDRMTSVVWTPEDNHLLAGDWYGRIWIYDFQAGALVQVRRCAGGIWSVAFEVAATTRGLCPKPRSGPSLLADHEVTRVVRSDTTYYAAVARGAIYASDNGLDWRFAYQP